MSSRKFPLILLLMAVIVSAGSLIQLQPASATFPGKNGKIAFARRDAAGLRQIFTVDPDGSGLAQLTFAGSNTDPRWSADGSKIVFESNRNVQWAIWMMNADGSDQTQVTNPPGSIDHYFPAFSPDGTRIVFMEASVGGTEIWVTNLDGTNQNPLTTGPNDNQPVWSPDGSRIAFVRPIGGFSHIFVMNADGSGQTDVTNVQNARDENPEWSPDGRMIAFDNNFVDGRYELWVMNADGSRRKQLSSPTSPLSDEHPAWSPDGTKIAFWRALDSIWVINADGSNPMDITVGQPRSDTDFAPSWQPLFVNPVGGVVMPTSKLDIITPFITLAGLIVAVSAVVAVKRRRD